MRMEFNLQLGQSQKLTMTPQLQQAIQILQFNSLELEQYIDEQLEQSPILEKTFQTEEEILNKNTEQNKEKEIDWKKYIEDLNNYKYTKGNYYNEDNQFNYENIISKEDTLQEHLLYQHHLTFLDKEYLEIGEYIINSIDDNGYFIATVEEVADYFKIKQSIVENVLQIIQTFDPSGVAARTLEECLLIQIKELEVEDEKIYKLIKCYLPDIALNKYPYVAKQLDISVTKVQEYCDFIKTLEPKPGGRFSCNQNRYITPDVVVKEINGEYVIINDGYSGPRLIIRGDYKKMITSCEKDSDVNKFLNDQFNSATWLIKSIEQRRETIYKVVEAIIKKQIVFFEKGKKYLKPMTLKEIADEIQVHESTVSRATNGKYMETPLGTFELKYFFTSGVQGNLGKGISSESIKVFMEDIIGKENPKRPLSDDKIMKELKIKGIDISRRTVAKYRDELGIRSSSKRKRY